jgi:hypothetical protein
MLVFFVFGVGFSFLFGEPRFTVSALVSCDLGSKKCVPELLKGNVVCLQTSMRASFVNPDCGLSPS